MKKILSLMIVVAAAAMVSCAGNQAKTAEVVETEAVATEVVAEPACCEATDSCAQTCETPCETAPAQAETAM